MNTNAKRSLLKHLGITAPLTLELIERIEAEVVLKVIGNRLDRIDELKQDLELIGGSDEAIEATIAKLQRANDKDIETIKRVIDETKQEAKEAQILKAKEAELMQVYTRKIFELSDEIAQEANRIRSVRLADLSRHITQGMKR